MATGQWGIRNVCRGIGMCCCWWATFTVDQASSNESTTPSAQLKTTASALHLSVGGSEIAGKVQAGQFDMPGSDDFSSGRAIDPQATSEDFTVSVFVSLLKFYIKFPKAVQVTHDFVFAVRQRNTVLWHIA